MLIRNGIIATAADTFTGDIRIEGEKFTEIGIRLDPGDNPVIDASGLYVLPGGVDVHTHLDLDVGIARATDDFFTGTVAAACGGTTSIVDHMAFGPRGCGLQHQLDVYHKLAAGKAVIDYSFHGVIQHVDDAILNELETLAHEGITSHKFYLTYDYKTSDKDAFRLLERAHELGIMMTVHPENDGVIACLRERYLREGHTEPIYHARSRPLYCEAEAIGRMILFSRMAQDAPLYIVHLSNGLGLKFIEEARKSGQKNVFAETCPQYLFLDESRYLEPNGEGLKYILSPPLRPADNKELLWRGLENGSIQTIATDHCPFFFNKEKQRGLHDFSKCPNGMPGIEARMPLLFSEGVIKGRISLNRFVELTSTHPAKLFGLYPQKGSIAVGADADLVLFDPARQVTLSHSMLHENVDYTPYEGIQLTGYPVMTLSRGEIIVRDNTFTGARGRGRFIHRKRPQLLL